MNRLVFIKMSTLLLPIRDYASNLFLIEFIFKWSIFNLSGHLDFISWIPTLPSVTLLLFKRPDSDFDTLLHKTDKRYYFCPNQRQIRISQVLQGYVLCKWKSFVKILSNWKKLTFLYGNCWNLMSFWSLLHITQKYQVNLI